MATIDRHFQTKGFSKDTRTFLSASWRSGTQKDYSAKFRKFSGWCSSKQIDPYTASLNQVADFLTSLYTDGLQYRTISGYRSMLSAVLPPVGNIPVGQHPYIIRLLKGVFNSRPPNVRLLPEWDLPLVLKLIQCSPFEPLRKAPLKFLTWKTVLKCFYYVHSHRLWHTCCTDTGCVNCKVVVYIHSREGLWTIYVVWLIEPGKDSTYMYTTTYIMKE